ncbi:hypothetical protein SFRURICE_015895, partial [Spodoptera frugiperda]
MRLIVVIALVGAAMAKDSDWQPILPDTSVMFSTYHTPERSLDTNPQLKIVNRRPIHQQYGSGNKVSLFNPANQMSDTCSIHKVSMNQELFFQYMEYEKEIPDLKEFTLCMWTKFHNHSGDHPLFSYA